jgi:hypothetical protein
VLFLYHTLLHLYPAAYRRIYGEEMLAVLREVQSEIREKGLLVRVVSSVNEVSGLVVGALREHWRSAVGGFYDGTLIPPRRTIMRSEFRFPKATPVLMTVILLAILLTIDKARSIELSGPYPSPQVGAIQPMEFTIVPTLLLVLAGACAAGFIVWGILFALRRSGIQRLSEMDLAPRSKSSS